MGALAGKTEGGGCYYAGGGGGEESEGEEVAGCVCVCVFSVGVLV